MRPLGPPGTPQTADSFRHKRHFRSPIRKSTTSQRAITRTTCHLARAGRSGRCAASLLVASDEPPAYGGPSALLIRWSLVRIQHGSLKESPVFAGLSSFPAAELSMSAEAILAQVYTDCTRALLVTP